MAPKNAISIVKSEISLILTAMKWNTRPSNRFSLDGGHSSLFKSLDQLNSIMNNVSDISELEPLVFITPFLNLIKAESVNGQITDLALTAVDKFLSYGLIELPQKSTTVPSSGPGAFQSVAFAADAIASAVTQTKFGTTNRNSDEVVLMKILHLLRTLLLLPAGFLVSNENICAILQSCFRICFESSLSELLRRTAELTLASMIQLFFSRLSVLASSDVSTGNVQHQQSSSLDNIRAYQAFSSEVEEPAVEEGNAVGIRQPNDVEATSKTHPGSVGSLDDDTVVVDADPDLGMTMKERVREAPSPMNAYSHARPYDLSAIYDLLKYLIDLLNSEENPDSVIGISLNLLTVALETGADSIPKCPSLLSLIRSHMTKFLILLLNAERIGIFAATCRICFLLFESMRAQLKPQLEVYVQRLLDLIVASPPPNVSRGGPEMRAIALDAVVKLLRLPCIASELFVNYDCDPYAQCLLQLVANALTETAKPPSQKLQDTQVIALNGLLGMVGAIEAANLTCDAAASAMMEPIVVEPQEGTDLDAHLPHVRLMENRHISSGSSPVALPSSTEVELLEARKQAFIVGSEKFNTKPRDGISYMQCCGVLADPLDATEVASLLFDNPRLDKKLIGEFLSSRKNGQVLAEFVKQHDFAGLRIDEALRVFLESFRIPGESQLVDVVLEAFAAQYVLANPDWCADASATGVLAYAILMLNTDQHNPVNKKQGNPMTLEAFRKILAGVNNNEDFDYDLVTCIYETIRDNEIILPSEQRGLVRENYLWKSMLQRNAKPNAGRYLHTPPGAYNRELFAHLWQPTVTALSHIFERAGSAPVQLRVVAGFNQCARMAASFGMNEVLDHIIERLCRFTTLVVPLSHQTGAQIAVELGRNAKARLAAYMAFSLASFHSDQLREGWQPVVTCLMQLFRADLLPNDVIESEDFGTESRSLRLSPNGPIRPSLSKVSAGGKQEMGVFSSFYQYFYSSQPSAPELGKEIPVEPLGGPAEVQSAITKDRESDKSNLNSRLAKAVTESVASAKTCYAFDDQTAKKAAKVAVADLNIVQLIADSKFLVDESLIRLIHTLLCVINGEESLALRLSTDQSESQLDVLWSQLTERTTELTSAKFYEPFLQAKQHQPHDETPVAEPMSQSVHLSASAPSLAAGMQSSPGKASQPSSPEPVRRQGHPFGSDDSSLAGDEVRTFCLELLIRVLMHNKDRVEELWPMVRGPLAGLVLRASGPSFLVERCCVGALRLAIRLMRKGAMTMQVLLFLQTLLVVRGPFLLVPPDSELHPFTRKQRLNRALQTSRGDRAALLQQARELQAMAAVHETAIARQIVRGLGDLMHTHAADLPSAADWQLVFALLAVCGAALHIIPTRDLVTHFEPLSPLRCCEFDSSLTNLNKTADDTQARSHSSDDDRLSHSWIVVSAGTDGRAASATLVRKLVEKDASQNMGKVFKRFSADQLALEVEIGLRDAVALEKACENLTFLIRDPAYLMPDNFEYCVHCLRVFIEACLCTKTDQRLQAQLVSRLHAAKQSHPHERTGPGSGSNSVDASDDEERNITAVLEEQKVVTPVTGSVAIRLLDLIHTLYMRTTSIHAEWSRTEGDSEQPDTETLWKRCWLPLLKATARLSVDVRKEVRSDALAYLQRELLSPILQPLSGVHWQQCFDEVLFPLLSAYLESIAHDEAATAGSTSVAISSDMNDPRMRAIPLITKVFLQHMGPLCALPDFPQLWSHLLCFMEHFITASSSDSLTDAVRESLKNVLLVMYTSSILRRDAPAGCKETQLWAVTVQQLSSFLPTLLDQLFPPEPEPVQEAQAACPEPTGPTVEERKPEPGELAAEELKAEQPADNSVNPLTIPIEGAGAEVHSSMERGESPYGSVSPPSQPTQLSEHAPVQFVPVDENTYAPQAYFSPPNFLPGPPPPAQFGYPQQHYYAPYYAGLAAPVPMAQPDFDAQVQHPPAPPTYPAMHQPQQPIQQQPVPPREYSDKPLSDV